MRRKLSEKETKKHSLYLRSLRAASQDVENNLLKAIFNGVRAVNSLPYKEPYTLEQAERGRTLSDEVMDLLAKATPKEMIQMFPIHKEYDGKKWSQKDYFYTMEYLRSMDINKPIGDKIEDFLLHYYNWDLMLFEIGYSDFVRKEKQIREEEDIRRIGNEIDKINKEVSKILGCAQDARQLLKQRAEELKQAYEEYLPHYEKVNKVSRLLSLKGQMAKRRYIKAYREYYSAEAALDIFMELSVHERKKFLDIQGLYECIETLAETDRGKANEWIIMLNQIKAE